MNSFPQRLMILLILLVPVSALEAQTSQSTRARELWESGEFREAAATWRRVLEQWPNDRSALEGLVDALEASGQWREAMAPLDRIIGLGQASPLRLRQRGLYAAWSGDHTHAVIWLRQAVARSPHNSETLGALAEVLSWNRSTRKEADRIFRSALAGDPDNPDLLLPYGDLLSWTPNTRDSAASVYRRVLVLNPGNVRARIGIANLQTWSGNPATSLQIYDSILAVSPTYSAALRGRGAALNQLGRYRLAEQALQMASGTTPGDVWINAELARAEMGRRDFGAARPYLTELPQPEFRAVRDSLFRATASAVEVNGLARRREGQLDLERVSTRATGAVGSLKPFIEYEHSRLSDATGSLNTDGYGVGLRFERRNVAAFAAGRLRSIESLGNRQWDARFALGWMPVDGVRTLIGASRSAVDETRRAIQGTDDGGELRGAVNANLGYLTIALEKLPGRLDAEGTVIAGRYTGMGLATNTRYGLDARLGMMVRSTQPWIRLGTGLVATRFGYNADLDLATDPAHRGGYFSPADYWRHEGILQAEQRFGSRVRWNLDGRLGREWVRQFRGNGTSSRTTAAIFSSLSFRLTTGLDLETRFLYLNAFDAFRMKELGVTLKVYK
jgi:tetratricopeptide (TPR) repeat protein